MVNFPIKIVEINFENLKIDLATLHTIFLLNQRQFDNVAEK